MTIKKYYIKKSGIEYELHSFSHKKQTSTTIDSTDLSLSRTEDSIFDIGDDVSIGFHDEGDSFVAEFNGDITSKQVNEELVMTVESYDGRVYRTEYITEVHEDKTIEFIVESIITNYTTLTYASTNATGVTLERFVINTETVGEVLTRILKDLNWQTRTDNNENFYFEPKGDLPASVVLNVGVNAFLEGEWKKSPNRLTNSCTVIGDKAKFNTNQTFAASASQTEFTVTYKITGNVRVTVNGTEKLGGQAGGTGSFDYSVNKEQKKIIFEVGLSGGESVIVYYEYELPIKINAKNEESIALYGTFPRKITDNTLKTTSDARKLAKTVVSVYGSPVTSGELTINWEENIDIGQTVQVIDTFNSIDQSFVVVEMTKNYPSGDRTIFAGIEELMILDMNKDINDRIKRLETKQDNTDIVQRYLAVKENINAVVKQGRVRTRHRSIAGDTMIWGNADFGVWEESNWGTVGNQSFILSSPLAGVLGLGQLGSNASEWVVDTVTSFNDIMIERFNFETYKDALTTATWNTAGETCTFTSSQKAQSESVALNGGTITTAKLTSTEVSGDFDYGMKVIDSSVLPIVHYRLNDDLATVNVVDSMGLQNGTANANTSTISVVGKIDNALEFNGTTDFFSIASNSPISETEGSISLWVKFNAIDKDQTVIISGVDTADGTSTEDQLFLRLIGSSNRLEGGWITSAEDDLTSPSTVMEAGTWYHIVLWWSLSANLNRIYINTIGSDGDVLTGDNKDNWVNYINVGRSMDTAANANYFDGVLDDIRIGTALTQADITAIYNSDSGSKFSDAYFEEVTNETSHTFTNNGANLKWIAEENAGSTGEITQIKIDGYA